MRNLLRVLPLVIFLVAWQTYSTLVPDRLFYFSSPVKVAIEFFTFFSQQDGFRHTLVTFAETILGFILGNMVGISVGLLLWFSRRVADISKPYLIAMGALPIFALAPVMIVWFGIGIWSKIMMAALSTVIIAIVQSYQGAMNADARYIRLMRVFKASKLEIFKTIILPSSLIWVFNSMKLNIGAALLGAFIGEFIAAEAGIGYTIIKASGLYNMGLVLSGCIILMGLALLLAGVVHLIEKRFMKWRVPEQI